MTKKQSTQKYAKFKIGDIVRPKKPYYGSNFKWFITHIYKDGTFVLRRVAKEDETIERYGKEEIVKL